MSVDKVSVIIPCYNNEKTIEQAVCSVLSDDHKNLEVIVVNDGSTDGCLDILKRLKTEHSEQITLVDQANNGANSARNKGLSLASGEYLQFLDADDYLVNSKLSKSVSLMNKDSNLCCVYSNGEMEKTHALIEASHKNTHRIAEKEFSEFTFGMNTNMPVWKTQFLRDTNELWDEDLSCWHETDYFFRLLIQVKSSKQVQHLPTTGFVRTVNQKGISGSAQSEFYLLGKLTAIKKILKVCESKNLMNKELEAQSDRFMWLMFKDAVLNGLDSIIRPIKVNHKSKSVIQKIVYLIPPTLLRSGYKVLRLFR